MERSKFTVGQTVWHHTYKYGVIVEIYEQQHPFYRKFNLGRKIDFNEGFNVVIKFDNGGPMGWSDFASNDLREIAVAHPTIVY